MMDKLIKQTEQFRENINMLRDFVDLSYQWLSEQTSKNIKKEMPEIFPLGIVFNFLDPDLYTKEKIAAVNENYGDVTETIIETMNDEKKLNKFNERLEKSEEKASVNIPIENSEKFLKAFNIFNRRIMQKEHIYKSALISLISTVEWFLSNLLHIYFNKYPKSLGNKDQQKLSLEDLKQLGSIEEASSFLITAYVENILRDSLEVWIKFLKDTIKIKTSDINPYLDSLVEAYQRRNLIVHNGGIINKIYLAKVPPKFANETTLGSKISVSQKYLDNIMIQFELCFLIIAAELSKKIAPSEEKMRCYFLNLSHEYLLKGEWETAKILAQITMNDKSLKEHTRLSAKINYWQAMKWNKCFDEIKKEIEIEDFSAKDNLFKLAQLILLDKMDTAMDLIPKILEDKKLEINDIFEWSLFREIRETETFKLKYPKKNIVESDEILET